MLRFPWSLLLTRRTLNLASFCSGEGGVEERGLFCRRGDGVASSSLSKAAAAAASRGRCLCDCRPEGPAGAAPLVPAHAPRSRADISKQRRMREKTAPFSRSASENKMENKVKLALRIFEMKDFSLSLEETLRKKNRNKLKLSLLLSLSKACTASRTRPRAPWPPASRRKRSSTASRREGPGLS